MSSSSWDADVFVALRVFDCDHEVFYATRAPESVAPLTWGCLKVSHRVIDPARSTAERPWHTHRREDAKPVAPDDIVKVDVELMPATEHILAGRRLRLEISSAEGRGAIPGFECAYDESYYRDAVNRVFTGGLLASSITLPVVPGRPAQEALAP